jgi:hypothetical protein
MLMQVMMQATMLVQVMLQTTSDDGVRDNGGVNAR